MEWSAAQGLWFLFLTAMGLFSGLLAYSFGRDARRQGVGWAFLVLLVLLNPITMPSMVKGQTTMLFLGCLALGQYAFENDCSRLGCFLWSIPFMKPHIALPFLILAFVLGGWRRAVGILCVVAVWHVLAGLVVFGDLEGSVRLFRIYIDYVSAGHKEVIYNRVADNPEILSWNRIVAALGGPAIDLKVSMTLAGFAVWTVLIVGRLGLQGTPRREDLDPAYLVAVTAVGALFFAQVLAYEMLLLALLAPLILQHLDANRKRSAYAVLAIVLFLLIPMNLTDRVADLFGLAGNSRARTLLHSHKCFGMATMALYLLIRGPARREKAPSEPSPVTGAIID